MCRHLAYLGPPVTLRSLLFDAPHALVRQAQTPRYQRAGRDNPDGWGVAWKTEGDAPGGHQRYRAATRMWTDRSFAGEEHATVVLAAARYASPGSELLISNVAPFTADEWLFSLNGFVSDFRVGFGDELRSKVSPRREQAIEGDTDSEVVFALVLDQLDAGASPGEALAEIARIVRAQSRGALNLLLTDGTAIAATAIDNSLFLRDGPGLLIASEPLDDDSWTEVDNGSLVENDRVTPIGGLP
ncbi:MAG: class II glutamine amidotransferase [Acidimicrobiia bacterium]